MASLMLSCRIALVLGLLGGAVVAAPAPQEPEAAATTPATAANSNACALIAPAIESFKVASPAAATPTVPASMAIDCLNSVPNKPEPAQQLVRSLKSFVQWQSTLAWLKDPPEEYMLPAVDIMGSLDNISSNAASGKYASEYEFQSSIVELISSAHDGHFAFRPDVFKAFGFRNNLTLDIVSVSIDGVQVPKLYHYSELMGMAPNSSFRGNGTVTAAPGSMPRAITMINGQPAALFIEQLNLKFSGYQDPDSEWNSQFMTYAVPEALSFLSGALVLQYPTLTVTYDNGDTRTEDNHAIIRAGADFDGVNTGEDFYNKFCNPDLAAANVMDPAPTPPTNTTTPAPAAPAPTIEGYPLPVVRDDGANITAGYFLNGTGYDNVAVLSVLGFSPAGDGAGVSYLVNFQQTVETFLAKSKEAGKTKLVIDVTSNGGGFVVAGYELFAQIFPQVDLFQAHNLRLTDSLTDLARLTNALPQERVEAAANGTQIERSALAYLAQSEVLSNLVPGGVFSPAGTNFSSVDEILSPVTLKEDRFTAYQSTPLNMPSADFNVTGTGSRSNPAPAVFKPEDVVLLTDGTCGSTCTLFAYLMIMQLNISTVAVGGRPQTGPMQSVAGVEGAQVFPLTSLAGAAQAVIALSDPIKQGEVNGSDLAILAEGYALTRGANPANPGAVNGKNAFSPSDAKTPLQFTYMPANCRFFYTKEMIFGPEQVWKRAVDATWTSPAEFCVEGSRMQPNRTVQMDPFFRASVQNSAVRGVGTGSLGVAFWVAVVVGLAAWM